MMVKNRSLRYSGIFCIFLDLCIKIYDNSGHAPIDPLNIQTKCKVNYVNIIKI